MHQSTKLQVYATRSNTRYYGQAVHHQDEMMGFSSPFFIYQLNVKLARESGHGKECARCVALPRTALTTYSAYTGPPC